MTFSFLMCSERSGSNLTTRLLDAHPEICAPSPAHLCRVLAPNLFRYGDLARDDAWSALTGDAARLLGAMTGVWRRRLSAAEIRAAASERALAAIVRAVYRAEAESHHKRRLFVKENHVHDFSGFLESAFPGARYLWLVRDPRDMALSWKRAAALRGGVVRAASAWRDDQRGFLGMADRLGERVVTVRYETLITEPETSLRRMCEHLGVRYAREMTSFHERRLTRRNAARISGWANVGRPLMPDNAGKFRRDLSAAEIRYVEALCAGEMVTFGYPPEVDDGASDLEALERQLLPLEPWEKPAYQELRAEERRAHAGWRRAVARIEARPPAPETGRP